MDVTYDDDPHFDCRAPRYAVAIYRGLAFVGFVPGAYRSVEPEPFPRFARKISLAADARLVAEGLAPRWAVAGYRLRAWDLVRREPLEDSIQ